LRQRAVHGVHGHRGWRTCRCGTRSPPRWLYPRASSLRTAATPACLVDCSQIHHQARSRCQVDDLRDRGRVTVAGDVALFALILQHKDDGCDPTSFGYRNPALPSPDPRRYREHPAYGVRKPPHYGPARMAMKEPTMLLLGRLRSLFLIAVRRLTLVRH
jgi:hypothetical protein